MVHFSYCLSFTLLHSIWQAALLYGFFHVVNGIAAKNHPAVKRNILFSLLMAQVILSSGTFLACYTGSEVLSMNIIAELLPVRQPLVLQLAPWLALAYALVITYKSVSLVTAYVKLPYRDNASRIKPSSDLKLFTTLKAYHFGIRRKVALWYSHNIDTPVTFGFLRPVILLPVALVNNLTVAETESLIIHELTHIRNNDYLLNWLLMAVETIFFFNPFIRSIGNRIRLEREKSCDVQVLQFDYSAIGYAETLLKAAILKPVPAPLLPAAATGKSQLVTRISYFTKEKNLQYRKRSHAGIVMALALLLVFANLYLVNSMMTIAKAVTPGEKPAALYKEMALKEIQSTPFSTAAITPASASTTKKKTAASPLKQEKTDFARAVNPEPTIPGSWEDATNGNMVVVPVSFEESGNSRQITLREESSETGMALTKVYRMTFINGEWQTQLLMTITEIKPLKDSCRTGTDTSMHFNPVQ